MPLLTTVLFIRNVPMHVKDGFKAFCAKRGTSMTKKIIELIQQTVKEEEVAERRLARKLKREKKG